VVLNASRNAVSTTDFALRSASAGSLSALVLAGNGLRELAGLSRLQQLNTLVLSHNEFEVRLACACRCVASSLSRGPCLVHGRGGPFDTSGVAAMSSSRTATLLTCAVHSVLFSTRLPLLHGRVDALFYLQEFPPLGVLPGLRKLSLSNNGLRAIPPTTPTAVPALSELRLAHNKLSALPPAAALAPWAARLRVLDIGHNRLRSYADCAATLVGVRVLSVKGNVEADAGAWAAVRVLDGARVDGCGRGGRPLDPAAVAAAAAARAKRGAGGADGGTVAGGGVTAAAAADSEGGSPDAAAPGRGPPPKRARPPVAAAEVAVADAPPSKTGGGDTPPSRRHAKRARRAAAAAAAAPADADADAAAAAPADEAVPAAAGAPQSAPSSPLPPATAAAAAAASPPRSFDEAAVSRRPTAAAAAMAAAAAGDSDADDGGAGDGGGADVAAASAAAAAATVVRVTVARRAKEKGRSKRQRARAKRAAEAGNRGGEAVEDVFGLGGTSAW